MTCPKSWDLQQPAVDDDNCLAGAKAQAFLQV